MRALILILSLAACRTSQAHEVCAELAKAEADVNVAQSMREACWSPDECRVLDEYLAAALDRLASARVVCGDVGDGSPFEVTP